MPSDATWNARPAFADRLRDHILVLDGAMGTMIQQADLDPDDFGGEALDGCNEHLVLTRPDVILDIHEQYLAAGADIIETNTFGATSLVLAEYDLQDKAYQINQVAAQLAVEAARKHNSADKPRYVAGSIGPTTKALTVTGGTTFDALVATYTEEARGLLDGGVDLLLLETTQDTLNLKAAAIACRDAFEATGRTVPLWLSATIEPMGTMLAGQSIDAFHTAVEHLAPVAIGMNCATGPEFMTDHLRTLSELATTFVHVYPNAGLPDEEGTYPETPGSLAAKVKHFVDEGWVNIIGGCCGTTPEHIAALAKVAAQGRPRTPRTRLAPAVSGIERLEIDPDNRPILVGERTNVIGSARFKRLVEAEDWDQAAEVGRAQVKKGGQILDVCLSHSLRDEIPDIDAFYPKLTRKVKVPLMVDSTDAQAIEAALKHSQGKALINSINLEDGEERFQAVCPLVRRFGAAVVVGCIDEDPDQGMAVTRERKLEVAQRSYDLLTTKYGIPARDIVFDPLVFPCGTGDENYVGSAKETIEGVRLITERFPECHTILGISNVAFGLPEAGREVLNSVFLYDAVQNGLTLAIVNTQGIERYPSISDQEKELARNLLYDIGDDPLAAFVAHFRGKKKEAVREQRPEKVEDRLAVSIVEGDKTHVHADLDEALAKYPDPLQIINGPLMAGMAEVGRLFNDNELIVAEVLQSAEVMKAAVAHLEPHMEKTESSRKGKILLATVKGDVHDIGKNLVEIILGNNGYDVVDLGIKCPPDRLIKEAREHKPDAIGLSGLLVKSAQQMVVTATDLKDAGIDVPVLVGGAALSARFTATKISPAYGDDRLVAYAKDAMQGLELMDRLRGDLATLSAELRQQQDQMRAKNPKAAAAPLDTTIVPLTFPPKTQVPAAPDFKRHVRHDASLRDVWSWVNPRMLYGKHLGLKGDPDKLRAEGDDKATKLHRVVEDLKEECARHGHLRTHAVWQFFPAQSDGDTVLVYDPASVQRGEPEVLETFTFQRQPGKPRRCLADYLHPVDSGTMDSVALFCVTAGEGVRDKAKTLKDQGEFLKSHAYQALALETAEAHAERLHAELRKAWGIQDPELTKKELFQARYQGKRYSFGYPACPDLEDQEKLWRLIDPTEIGVELTEGHMMDPEASVSAIVFWHPEATYFQVG